MDSKTCPMCDEELREGVHCHACDRDLHFHCAGITEMGYRKLGERKSVWRCQRCKQAGNLLPPQSGPDTSLPVSPSNIDQISASLLLSEMRSLAAKFVALETIPHEVKSLKEEFINLQSIVKLANESSFAKKLNEFENRLTKLENDKKDQANLILTRLDKIENELREKEQWSRASNIEIKGIKETKNENLFNIISALGSKINYPISKAGINFVTRVPTRDPKFIKPIIVSFNNRYVKEDFIAAARVAQKEAPLMPSALGLEGKDKIYLNDHLTTENKILLNKTRKLKQDMGFQYVWVKHCKIYLRKSDTSPVIHIKSEKDLSKLTSK